MNVRPYKFLVIPVVQEVDDEGNVLREITPDQPVAVYGIEGLQKYAEDFGVNLATSSAAMNNAGASKS